MSKSVPTIEQWLKQATADLKNAGIETARLDALILLEHMTTKDRSWLLAHLDDALLEAFSSHSYGKQQPSSLPNERLEALQRNLERRVHREPLAYILGNKEFYGRKFQVTPDVLIPRPESEALIELAKKHLNKGSKLIDVGTGSGCLAITLALERPDLSVDASDISRSALGIARSNAKSLKANVNFKLYNLLHNNTNTYDGIVANLPYVDPGKKLEPELQHEPANALFAQHEGLALYEQLFEQISSHLSSNGVVIIEAEPTQHDAIASLAKEHGLVELDSDGFALAFKDSSNSPVVG